MPLSVIGHYQYFTGNHCLHFQGYSTLKLDVDSFSEVMVISYHLHGVTSNKTITFITAAVRNSNAK